VKDIPSHRKSMKKAIFQVHLWAGIVLGLYAFLIGVTGSVLVFREEIVERIKPLPNVDADQPAATVDQIRSRIQAAYPDWYPWSLEFPAEPERPWSSYLLQSGRGRLIFADATGAVIGEQNLEGTWLEWFEKFHSHLLVRNGRLYNGIAGLLLFMLALTGLVLWWPEHGQWPAAFRIVRYSNWKGIVYDLHRVGGVLTLLFTLLFCITGAYFTWPAAYRSGVASVLPVKPSVPSPAVGIGPLRQPLDTLIDSARQAVPDAELVRILVPQGKREVVRVVFRHGTADEHHKTSQALMNPYTAEVVAVDRYGDRLAGDHLVSFLGPLHTGAIGGKPTEVIWALAGLALPGLYITGLLMWWNRVLRPRLRRSRPATQRETIGTGQAQNPRHGGKAVSRRITSYTSEPRLPGAGSAN
jgi:uncharacterized iron-regulated membrane protein